MIEQLKLAVRAFRTSRYATLALFVTLLMTDLAEFQYSQVLPAGRSEAELAALFGRSTRHPAPSILWSACSCSTGW